MKYIGVIVTIVIFLIGGFIGYGKLQAKADNTAKEVVAVDKKVDDTKEEIKEEVKEVKEKTEEEIEENEKIDTEQTIALTKINTTQEFIVDTLKMQQEILKALTQDIKKEK